MGRVSLTRKKNRKSRKRRRKSSKKNNCLCRKRKRRADIIEVKHKPIEKKIKPNKELKN